MPGKVNPTQCEAMVMICIQVIGDDSAVAFAGSQGNFELNAMRPIIINNFLHSATILADACTKLREYCIDGAELNRDQVGKYVDESLMLVTALSPAIGYDKASAIAHKAGRKVSLSLSDPFCVDRHRADFRDLIKNHVDILFANESEICSLYETKDFEEAAGKVSGECEIAVLTRSEKGAEVITAKDRVKVPAAPVAKVVDTTGAGDLFAAGFLFGYTHGKDMTTCAKLGALAAAEIISHFGARPEAKLSDLAAKAGLL